MGIQISKQIISLQCGIGLIEVQGDIGRNPKAQKMRRIYPEEESCGWESVLGRGNSMACLKCYIRVCEHRELTSFKCPWITVAGREAGGVPIILYSAIWCFHGLHCRLRKALRGFGTQAIATQQDFATEMCNKWGSFKSSQSCLMTLDSDVLFSPNCIYTKTVFQVSATRISICIACIGVCMWCVHRCAHPGVYTHRV